MTTFAIFMKAFEQYAFTIIEFINHSIGYKLLLISEISALDNRNPHILRKIRTFNEQYYKYYKPSSQEEQMWFLHS